MPKQSFSRIGVIPWMPLFGLLLLFLCFSAPASGSPLVLNTDDEYPLSSPDGTGFEDKILKEAFRRIGKEIKIIHLPSERALVNANAGIDDGNFVRIAGLEKTYPNLIRVPEKIWMFEFAVFSKKGDLKIKDWESLKPFDVGIITGWKILEANVLGTRSLTKVNDSEALFNLLLKDRADLVIFDRLQGQVLLKNKGLSEIKSLKPNLAKQDMFVYLHRRHAELVAPLVKALQTMKQDGTFQRLIDSVLYPK